MLSLVDALVGETLLGVFLGVTLGLFSVNEVESSGLNLAVDKGTGEASQQLLGHGVGWWLACRARRVSR